MTDVFAQIREVFLEEAAQSLETLEICYLKLEEGQDLEKTLAEAFRNAHNIKGSAGSTGFPGLAAFVHQIETLLLKLKQGELRVTPEICSALLKSNDCIMSSLPILQDNPAAAIRDDGLTAELVRLTTEPQAPSDTGHSGGAGPAAPEAAPAKAMTAAEAHEAEMEALFYKLADAKAAQSGDEAPPAPDPKPAEPVQAAPAPAPAAHSAPPDAGQPPAAAAGAAGGAPGGSPRQKTDEGIRVSLLRLEKLMNSVGELTILESVFNQHVEQLESDSLVKAISELKKISREIQHISMSLRMIPVKQTFTKMQRIVRDTAVALGKEITLHTNGDETELDRTILEKLGDPLVHLIRNACDHGLEMPDERKSSGKASMGNVTLIAQHRGSQVMIEVKDDGKGLDPKKLIAKAIEKKILKPNATLSDSDAYNLIFEAGFSTKAQVTEISGRGVGMDVVKTNISALGGEIQVETKLGSGSTFRILLPLTLAIIDGFLVRIGEERFVIPITQVAETVRVLPNQILSAGGSSRVYELRNEPLPVINMTGLLRKRAAGHGSSGSESEEFHALILRASNGMGHCILVDEIMGQQQVVIKSLNDDLAGLRGVSGSTILGDGQPALILDIAELMDHHATGSQRGKSSRTITRGV